MLLKRFVGSETEDVKYSVAEALNSLPGLQGGLNVNVRFNDVQGRICICFPVASYLFANCQENARSLELPAIDSTRRMPLPPHILESAAHSCLNTHDWKLLLNQPHCLAFWCGDWCAKLGWIQVYPHGQLPVKRRPAPHNTWCLDPEVLMRRYTNCVTGPRTSDDNCRTIVPPTQGQFPICCKGLIVSISSSPSTCGD